MTIITRQDTLHPDSYVCKRISAWFKKHNLDYEKFKREGIHVDELRATGEQKEKIDALEKTAINRMSK